MKIYKPVFIIGSYRGGTSLLFRLLSESKELWSMYREANHLWLDYSRSPEEKSDTVIFEKNAHGNFFNIVTDKEVTDLEQARKNFDSHYNFCTYNNYAFGYLGRVKRLRECFSWLLDLLNFLNFLWKSLFIRNYRFIDKTPPNMYRVEFLKAFYPDAKFIYLVRDKEANIKSLISAWCHPKKFKYLYRKYLGEVNAQGYKQNVWKFFIPADYKNWMTGKTIEEICTHQYEAAHQAAQKAFSIMNPEDYIQVNFEEFLAEPQSQMKKICGFLGIGFSPKMAKIIEKMPAVNTDRSA